MSLAVAECLLANSSPDRIAFADAFVRSYKRDPRAGYARGFQEFLHKLHDGQELLSRIRPHSSKGGAAMRAGVIGLLPELAEVLRISERQARITHDTSIGIASAQAAALMVHHQAYALGPREALPAFLTRWVPSVDWALPHQGPAFSGGDVMVRVALEMLIRHDSLEQIWIGAVDRGGDTDTVAVIATAAACVSREVRAELPTALYYGLEAGPYGQKYLLDIDRRLAEAFGLPDVAREPVLR